MQELIKQQTLDGVQGQLQDQERGSETIKQDDTTQTSAIADQPTAINHLVQEHNLAQRAPHQCPGLGRQDKAESAAVQATGGQGQSFSTKVISYVTSRPPAEVENAKLLNDNKLLRDDKRKILRDLDYFEKENSKLKANLDAFKRTRQEKYDQVCGEKLSLQERCHDLTRRAQADAKTIEQLQQQVTHFKVNISAATRMPDQMADDVLKSMVDDVFRAIQNFAVRFFRGSSYDYNLVPEPLKQWMDVHIPYAHILTKEHWINIAISIISKTLADRAGLDYYFGLPDTTSPVRAAADLAANLHTVMTAEQKGWLESTRKMLGVRNPGAVGEAHDRLVANMVHEIQYGIAHAMHVKWSEAASQELSRVFTKGLELFRVMHRQHASFHVQMAPAYEGEEPGRRLNPETMIDVDNAEDEVALRDRLIEISVYPLVYKTGDERGEMDELVTIISKARVVPMKRPAPIRRQRRVIRKVYYQPGVSK